MYKDFGHKLYLILFPQVKTSITHLTSSSSSSSSKRKLEADSRLLSPIARTVASIPIRQLYCLLLQQGSSSSLFQARPFLALLASKKMDRPPNLSGLGRPRSRSSVQFGPGSNGHITGKKFKTTNMHQESYEKSYVLTIYCLVTIQLFTTLK